MSYETACVPDFSAYLPGLVSKDLQKKYSKSFSGVPGVTIVGGVDSKYASILTPDAVQYVADLYKQSLGFESRYSLATVLEHRRMKRKCVDEKARVLAAAGNPETPLKDVRLEDNTVALGWRDDLESQALRTDKSWRVRPIHPLFDRFHDTISGPPTAAFIETALTSGTHFFMADFEDSSTVSFPSVMDGLLAVTAANAKDASSRQTKKRQTQMLLRHEGLHLPNGHVFVEGQPIPAHLFTIGLYLFHNWEYLAALGTSPAFYIPKLETAEESGYMARLFGAAESLLQRRAPSYQLGSISAFIIIENVWSVYQCEEMLFQLRDYVCGMNTGWHDYMASIGGVHRLLPHFNMPPKSNLRIIIEHLEAYQRAIVSACTRRGAIPIGGMNGATPPSLSTKRKGIPAQNAATVDKEIETAFIADFWTQTGRGLRGVWLAYPPMAAVANQLLESPRYRELVAQPLPPFDLTHERLLVTGLRDVRPSLVEVEHNMSDALQYLAAYLAGMGNVGLTVCKPSGVYVTLMEDAATLERSRREIWSILRYGKTVYDANGNGQKFTTELLDISMQLVFSRIGDGLADVACNVDTKVYYDIAFKLCRALFTEEDPCEYFTAHALSHLLRPYHGHPARLEKVLRSKEFTFLKYPNLSRTATIEFTTNEAFAPASSLIKSEDTYPRFQPHEFGPQGQVYDGWETARHNINPPDYVILVLKEPSFIYGVNVDTCHFFGNHAIATAVQGLVVRHLDHQRVVREWVTLVPRQLTNGNARNFFYCVPGSEKVPVHKVRLNMYPDGGIARFEMYGEAATGYASKGPATSPLTQAWVDSVRDTPGFPAGFKPNPVVEIRTSPTVSNDIQVAPSAYNFPSLVDLAALELGGAVIASSSAHYSNPGNMIKPRRGFNMVYIYMFNLFRIFFF